MYDLRKLLTYTILLVTIIHQNQCFTCPPISQQSGKSIAAGSNEVFEQIAKCSYQFVHDISTNQSTLYTGFSSNNFKSKLQLYNGKLFGAWAFTNYYNSIWWCNESDLLMAIYVGVAGSGIEYLWRLFLNQDQSSSSSSSVAEGSICGGINMVLGNAKLSAEFIDGVIVISLPNDTSRLPIVKEVSMNFFPFANTLYESIKVFDSHRKDILSRKMKDYIKHSMVGNLLPAIEISIRKGLNKCLPLAKKLMSGFDGKTSNKTSHPNRIQSVISKLQHPKTPKRSAVNELKKFGHEMRSFALSQHMYKYSKFEERAQILLSDFTPFFALKSEVKTETP